MNAKTVKRLRHKVYGEGSKRNEYDYSRDFKGALICRGKRQEYLQLKKKEKCRENSN